MATSSPWGNTSGNVLQTEREFSGWHDWLHIINLFAGFCEKAGGDPKYYPFGRAQIEIDNDTVTMRMEIIAVRDES